jgi:uncharacterized protein (TIGR02147 family)
MLSPRVFLIFILMKEIFKYIDFRKYLSDYYLEKKNSTRHFSYRFFADKAGIKSPVFLKQVIDGERNLTRPAIEKFMLALGLNKKECLFFKNLVLFNQSRTALEKQECYSVMLSMMDQVQERQIAGDQYLYFEKWYHSAIRELVCLFDFQDDFDLIAKTVKPRIKVNEAKKAIRLLSRLKLIARQKDGTYRQTDSAIISNDDMVALARRSFNSEMLLLARNANETFPPAERNISGITMGISRPCYDVLLAEMAAFKERVKAIVNQDEQSTNVYQFNLQFFPLSEDIRSLRKPGYRSELCGE